MNLKFPAIRLLLPLLLLLVSACNSSNNPDNDSNVSPSTEVTPDPPVSTPDQPGEVNPPQSDPEEASCSADSLNSLSTTQLVAEIDLVNQNCMSLLTTVLIQRIEDGAASPSGVALLLADALANGTTPNAQIKLEVLDSVLNRFQEQIDQISQEQVLGNLNVQIVDLAGANEKSLGLALTIIDRYFIDLCGTISHTPDCLDGASAVFVQHPEIYTVNAAVNLFREILAGKISISDPQTQNLAALILRTDPEYSRQGAQIAERLFDRMRKSNSDYTAPPDFKLNDGQIELLTSALISVYTGVVTAAEVALQQIYVADAIDGAYLLTLNLEQQAVLFDGLQIPADTINQKTRVIIEQTYLPTNESCPHVLQNGRVVTPQLYLPATVENDIKISQFRNCETYRAATDYFLTTVGGQFQSMSSNLPDTNPNIFYFNNTKIFTAYLDVYLDRRNIGGLFVRFGYVNGDTRYNTIYISNGIANKHVIAHEYSHYLFGRQIRSENLSFTPIEKVINEGFAEYVALHAFGVSAPLQDGIDRICNYPRPYMTLATLLEGGNFGIDYELAYVYVYFLINREPATFTMLLQAFRNGTVVTLSGSLLEIDNEHIDVGPLDDRLHAMFDSELFCGEN